MNAARFFFYLLILLLPVQLGRHFFFDFSLIAGVRSSYLAPTIYLTDVISLLIITFTGISVIRRKKFKIQSTKLQINSKSQYINSKRLSVLSFEYLDLFRIFNFEFWILFICYLLFTSIFIADNYWAALYKIGKIIEFSLLGWAIITIRPRLSTIMFFLSVAGMYSAFLAIAQFVLQRSVGGWLWWLGERTFYASTPAIATISWGGTTILRPYATFAHPNVLGGFLAIAVPWVLYEMKKHRRTLSVLLLGWYGVFLALGIVSLFLTSSRSAWIVAIIGTVAVWERGAKYLRVWMHFHSGIVRSGLLIIVIIAAVAPLIWNSENQSVHERALFLRSAAQQLSLSPLMGTGLNNSLSAFYPFQPVHNVFVLILVETGIIGFGIAWRLWWKTYLVSLMKDGWLFVILIQLFLLGLFDHYLVTLQQGMLLVTLLLSLVFLPKDAIR